MPIRDVAAMNASLDNDYGTTRGPNAAASHELALFNGDPMIDVADGGGTELTALDNPGYARVTVSPADWLPAANGRKDLTSPKQLPATTGEWLESPTHWALIAAGVMWDCAPLNEPLEVTGPGAGPLVSVTVFYDDAVVDDDVEDL
jgi:hypothetical protein